MANNDPNGKPPGPPLKNRASGEARLDGMVTRWRLVTPEMAEVWLRDHNTRNRNLTATLPDRYAAMMTGGDWIPTHQGIAFDTKGRLSDGQHRLHAIIIAGAPVWMLVTEGLSEEAIEAIDRNKKRTTAHTLQIMGFEMSGPRAVAIARAMVPGPNQNTAILGTFSDQDMRRFIERHMEAIAFACSLPKSPAPYMAVIARATYRRTHEELRRFDAAFRDQIAVEDQRAGDKSARKIAAYMKSTKSYGGAGRTELYRKAQAGLHHYLSGTDIEKLYAIAEDLFPLPEAEAAAKAEGE